ncbi:MAG: Gx transporter family protein [Nitrospirota bacterium]|jgi:heptaprenyl diphosphate synthase
MAAGDHTMANGAEIERQVYLAWFAALAVAIHSVEALIPSPLPGVKLGLANAITLVVLLIDSPRAALVVTLVRIFVGALLIGTFLGPGFLLSLTGGLAAWAVMAASRPITRSFLSALGLSVLGAVGHILAQIATVYLLLIPNAGLLHLVPTLVAAAIVTGAATGLVAARLVVIFHRIQIETQFSG